MLLNQVDSFTHTPSTQTLSLPFAIESSWAVGKLDKLKAYTSHAVASTTNFNIGVGQALVALSEREPGRFLSLIEDLRISIARNLSIANTASLQDCHDAMLKFHVLAEVEAISGLNESTVFDKPKFISSLDQRLDVLGPFLADKQYILGLRRAAMQISLYVNHVRYEYIC